MAIYSILTNPTEAELAAAVEENLFNLFRPISALAFVSARPESTAICGGQNEQKVSTFWAGK